MDSADFAIRALGLSKCYTLYDHPADRLKQMLMCGRRRYYREFWALRETSFELPKGQVLGLVGRNGAGKSTLLQLVCGTLAPSGGSIEVRGRVSALLELGSGFNPEFSGRENVYVYASILGLSSAETDARFDEIVAFSGIVDFIDQPVKTYSSGMFVRLAFAVATSVDPDILIVDEALSVGDGEFARKSFDRIMSMRKEGKTILFCSHSTYHIEAICDQAIWLDHGRLVQMGKPQEVVSAYNAALLADSNPPHGIQETEALATLAEGVSGTAFIEQVKVSVDGVDVPPWLMRSEHSSLSLRVDFYSDPALPVPTVAVGIENAQRWGVTTAGTLVDGFLPVRRPDGRSSVELVFPNITLLRGHYRLSVYLACEKMVHIYDQRIRFAEIQVEQEHLLLGTVLLPHEWRQA